MVRAVALPSKLKVSNKHLGIHGLDGLPYASHIVGAEAVCDHRVLPLQYGRLVDAAVLRGEAPFERRNLSQISQQQSRDSQAIVARSLSLAVDESIIALSGLRPCYHSGLGRE